MTGDLGGVGWHPERDGGVVAVEGISPSSPSDLMAESSIKRDFDRGNGRGVGSSKVRLDDLDRWERRGSDAGGKKEKPTGRK